MTPEHEIVWEFINPHMDNRNMNMVYRAYRVPYAWVPQAEHGPEVAIVKPDMKNFRMPGAAPLGAKKTVSVQGTVGYPAAAGDCVGATN